MQQSNLNKRYCLIEGLTGRWVIKSAFETLLIHVYSYIYMSNFDHWLKVGFSPSKKKILMFFNESSLKMMKNAFYFIWKALFVLKMLTFLCWLFPLLEKTVCLERWCYFKFYDVTAWLTTITTHILSNISRSKGNHTLKMTMQ